MNVIRRKMRIRMTGAVVACGMFLVAFLPTVRAQNPPPPHGRFGSSHFAGAEPFSGGKVVTGAPYSAQAVTEHIQTLADGNIIHTTTTANVYRDNQGRTRREQEISSIGPWATQGGARKVIFIADPVSGLIHTLNPDTQVAQERPFRAHGEAWKGAEKHRQRPDNPNVKTESLSTQVIGGVTAQGTRITRTIPAGQIGNQAPIVITTERWYSPDLQTEVMRKQSNPQYGTTTFQLTNIVRAEPEAGLFQVPPNYTIKSAGPPPDNARPLEAPTEQ